MTYNRFLYNTALYNAGREEAGALIRSIIQAHTGPHIQAVVGESPESPADQSGLAFISDFTIRTGTSTRPPAAFNFPDLSARLRGVRAATHDLGASLRAQLARDLQAAIYLTNRIPDLPASIFGLLQKDLLAFILGELGEKDLAASIFIPQLDLRGTMFGLSAPDLGGRILGNAPGDLGAKIWAPKDLAAILSIIFSGDVPATITGFGFLNLPGTMLGLAAPLLNAYIRAFASATHDLPAAILGSDPSDLPSVIVASGGYDDMDVFIRPTIADVDDLAAYIRSGSETDLGAIISFLSANVLGGTIGALGSGTRDRALLASVLGLIPVDLSAIMLINSNVAILNAFIEARRGITDLGAFIRVSETFITAILTVTTLAARDLRATVGGHACAGGTALKNMLAYLNVQHARDLRASIESFVKYDLGASVNSSTIIHALDVIDVLFSPRRDKKTTIIRALDTLAVRYSPFRGQNLRASIIGDPPHVNLNAAIRATFPLPRVSPSLSVMTSADLRVGEDLNIQQIRLQLEGTLLEFLYVNGTDDAFIMDPNQQWRINVRSFQPLASNLFGDHAAARICSRGDLGSFATIDEAVRSCIARVLGLDGQSQLGASISSLGQFQGLRAFVGISSKFGDLSAFASRVFSSDPLIATVQATGGYGSLGGSISGVGVGLGWGSTPWGSGPWGT